MFKETGFQSLALSMWLIAMGGRIGWADEKSSVTFVGENNHTIKQLPHTLCTSIHTRLSSIAAETLLAPPPLICIY